MTDTPYDLLMACHERIRRFVGGMNLIAQLPDPADPRIPDACDQIARYLREGLPLHVRDEEESLAPRLPSEAAARMVREHREHEPLLAEALAALASRDVPAIARSYARLHPEIELHLREEEEDIFPHLSQIVDPEAFVAEIRARRAG